MKAASNAQGTVCVFLETELPKIVHVIIIRSAVSRLYLLHTCMYSCVFEAFGRKPFVRLAIREMSL